MQKSRGMIPQLRKSVQQTASFSQKKIAQHMLY